MQHTENISTESARTILEINADSEEQQIRAAYLAKVKEFPPDKSPQQFERIRQAYELLLDPDLRARESVFGVDPHRPLASVIGDCDDQRHFVGPELWLEALKEKISQKEQKNANE